VSGILPLQRKLGKGDLAEILPIMLGYIEPCRWKDIIATAWSLLPSGAAHFAQLVGYEKEFEAVFMVRSIGGSRRFSGQTERNNYPIWKEGKRHSHWLLASREADGKFI
jgi:hypothetical protein